MKKELSILTEEQQAHYAELKQFLNSDNAYPKMKKKAQIMIEHYEKTAEENALDIVELCNTGTNWGLKFEQEYGMII